MQQHGVNVQRFRVAENKQDAEKIANDPTFSMLNFTLGSKNFYDFMWFTQRSENT